MAAYVLPCEVCGQPFEASRAHARTCSGACRKKIHRRSQTRLLVDARYEHEIWSARRRGELAPDEAVLLLAFPSTAMRDRLAAIA